MNLAYSLVIHEESHCIGLGYSTTSSAENTLVAIRNQPPHNNPYDLSIICANYNNRVMHPRKLQVHQVK